MFNNNWFISSKIVAHTGLWFDGIRMTYGDLEASNHGGLGGNENTCNIASGDKIIRVTGRKLVGCGLYYALQFHTKDGATCTFNSASGGGTSFDISMDGQYLSHISGTLCTNYIGNAPGDLTFHWSPIPPSTTTTTTTNEPTNEPTTEPTNEPTTELTTEPTTSH